MEWSPVLCCSVGGEAALTRKMMFSFYRCHHAVVCSLTSIQEARGKRFQSFTGQLQRHSTRQRRQSNHSFVTEHIETTVSVSYPNSSVLVILFSIPIIIIIIFHYYYYHHHNPPHHRLQFYVILFDAMVDTAICFCSRDAVPVLARFSLLALR